MMPQKARHSIVAAAPAMALAAALPLPFASLPLFALGQWDKAEPLLIWFHASTAFALLAVLALVLTQGRAALQRIAHPYVLMPLALGVWSLLTAPWQQLPILSLTGAPQSGFGALWQFGLAGYVACARLAITQAVAWRRLVWMAGLTGLAVAAIKAWDIYALDMDSSHLLIFVAAYYCWIALALPILGLGQGRATVATLAAVALVLAAASLAKTGMVAMAGGLAAALLWHWRRGIPARLEGAAIGLIITLAAFLPLVALRMVPMLHESASLLDRYLLQNMILADMGTARDWIIGHGWGRSQDTFQTWLATMGERLWQPKWDLLTSDYFHSHSWVTESLHAQGIPGLLLTLAGFIALPLFAAPRHRAVALGFAVAYTLFHTVWFQLVLSLPFVAMAMAALADDRAPRRLPPPRIAGGIIAVLALAQIATAAALLQYGLGISRAGRALDATPPRQAVLPADFRGSDMAVANLIRQKLAQAGSNPVRGHAFDVEAITPIIDFVDARAASTRTVLLLTGGLDTMAQIHLVRTLPNAEAPGQLAIWKGWLDHLLELAPRRNDQTVSYLTLMLALGRLDQVDALALRLLSDRPNDPIGLYYRSIVFLQSGVPARREAGLGMLRQALANGLELFMPVDPAVKALANP